MEVSFFATTLERLSAWALQKSEAAMPLSIGCCPCEGALIHSKMPVRFNPRQADVLVIAGAITEKSASVIRRIYDQMPDPKYVIGVGNCAINGGLFADSYAVVRSLSDIIPVDVYVKGCPPVRADFALAIQELNDKIKGK